LNLGRTIYFDFSQQNHKEAVRLNIVPDDSVVIISVIVVVVVQQQPGRMLRS
jgi:hypothetical protein